MFQPVRESLRSIAARHVGALAFAGLLALCLGIIQSNGLPTPVGGAAARGSTVAAPVSAGTSAITGQARVIDGDTLDVAGVRVRLEGIDAPETDQRCARALIGTWACGHEATEQLGRLVRDRLVTCQSRGLDAYGRMLGICVTEGLELNADMVRQGFAWAFVKYSQAYVEQEAKARTEKLGIWQGKSTPAWIWRAERWKAAEDGRRDAGGAPCVIKGNISRVGNVYHMPWDRWYDRTKIETTKGERWFCSEGEAVAAGWRAAAAR